MEPTSPDGHRGSTSLENQGIDIRQALEILSERTSHDHSHQHASLCNDKHVSDEAKSMGQTINLTIDEKDKEHSRDEMKVDGETPSIQERQELVDDARKERQRQIRDRLECMSCHDLIKAVLEAQSERVVAYREYESGLDTVLQTGNMSNYPTVCARATASFSVLSDTINAIRNILVQTHKRSDLEKLLNKLQQFEKDKLNLTAALHLERIREHNENMQVDGDERVGRLLREGVASMKQRVGECVVAINDVLEELQCALADEEG